MLLAYVVKSTAILVVAGLVAWALRRSSAAARHLVWTAAAGALLALPLLAALLPAVRVPVADGAPAVFRVWAQGTAGGGESSVGSGPAMAGPYTGHVRSVPARSGLPWPAVIWGAGTFIALARLLAAWLAVWRIRREAQPCHAAGASEVARSLGVGRAVAVLETTPGQMPMTCGILRPAVLLPAGASGWGAARLRVVLLHEVAHVRRADVATHLLARIAWSLNWWNPLAWFAWRQIVREGERAADDLVLAAGEPAAGYAGQLLEIARGFRPAGAAAALGMARPNHLEARLRAILDTRVNRRPAGRLAVSAAVVGAILVAAPFAAVEAQNPAMPAEVPILLRSAADQKNYATLDQAADKYERLRQFEVARKLLESSLDIRGQVSGERSAEYAAGLVKLGGLAARTGQWQQAAADYGRAVSLGDRPEASPALFYLGFQAYAAGDRVKAEDYFQRLLNTDPNGPQAGPALAWMAAIRARQQGRAGEAEPLFVRAMAAEDPYSDEYANTLDLYAFFLAKQGRRDEADQMKAHAAEVRRHAPRQNIAGPTREGVFRIGGSIAAPKLLAKVEPQYDEGDRTAGVAGTVVVSVEIGTDGRVHNPLIVRGLTPGLDQKALEAIAQWHFQPGMKSGAPVTVAATIEVNFRLM